MVTLIMGSECNGTVSFGEARLRQSGSGLERLLPPRFKTSGGGGCRPDVQSHALPSIGESSPLPRTRLQPRGERRREGARDAGKPATVVEQHAPAARAAAPGRTHTNLQFGSKIPILRDRYGERAATSFGGEGGRPDARIVESGLDRGATFHLSLPAIPPRTR